VQPGGEQFLDADDPVDRLLRVLALAAGGPAGGKQSLLLVVAQRPLADPGFGLNVEHFLIDRPSTSIWPGTAELVPDALNYGWRDYGPRVGIWRMIESLDR
jgi:hypothetical protein